MGKKENVGSLNRIIDALDHYLSPSSIGLEQKSKRIFSGFMVIFTAPVLLIFSFVHLLEGDYLLGIFLLFAGLSLIATIRILKKIERLVVFLRINIAFIGLLFFYILVESGPHGYMAHWLYIYPMATFFLLGKKEGLFVNSLFFICSLIFLMFQDHLIWVVPHDSAFKSRFLISLFLVNVLAYTFELVRNRYEKGMIQNKVKLEEETEKLADAKKDAESANAAKSEFLANMSHELRTPLNHIIGFTEVVVDGGFGDLNDQQKEYLRDALASSRHLLSLINDILDLSKVEAGKLELALSEVHLPLLLENSLVMIKQKAMKHKIQLSCEINGIPDSVQADERKINQIQYNLLSNAVKFTPDGGEVRLTALEVAGDHGTIAKVKRNNHTDSRWVHINVADTGIGLAKDDLERIFLPFEQVENTKSRKYKGTGLGLSLTRKLVKLHGGEVWAESDGIGKGTTLHYVLPISYRK